MIRIQANPRPIEVMNLVERTAKRIFGDQYPTDILMLGGSTYDASVVIP